MEFNTFNGTTFENLHIEGEKATFTVNVLGREANIEVTGIENVEGDLSKVDTLKILNIDIDIVDMQDDTFNKVIVDFEDDSTITINGNMKGIIVNMEDFSDLCYDEDESDCDDCDDCDNCGCGCGCDCDDEM